MIYSNISRMAFISCIALVITACAGQNRPSDRQIGAVLGGVAGGAAGSQIGSGSGTTIATVVGTIAGAALGARLGERFGQQDRARFANTLEATPTGQTNSWSNNTTGNSYALTPTNNFQTNSRSCREFVMRANTADGQDRVEGTACRQPDGDWRVQ